MTVHWVTGIVNRSRSNSKREHNHIMADRSQYKKHVETLKKEIQRLCDLGVLKWQADSKLALPTFSVPKMDNTVWVVSDFREINKQIGRKPFPIPKSVQFYKSWKASHMPQPLISTWATTPLIGSRCIQHMHHYLAVG